MKKYFYLFVAAVAALAMTSCDKNKPEDPGKGANFTIKVSDITTLSATVTVTPKDTSALYYFDCLPKELLEEYTDEELLEEELSYLLQMVEFYNAYGLAVSFEDFLSKGEDSYDFDKLDPETEYVAFAFLVDLETKSAVAGLEKKEFTTSAKEMSANKVTVTYADGVINITTTNNDPYVFYAEYKADYEEYEPDYSNASLCESLDEWINAYISMYAEYGYEMTWGDFLEGGFLVYSGNKTFTVDEWFAEEDGSIAGGEAVAYAAPYKGYINGEAASTFFTVDAKATDTTPKAAPKKAPKLNKEVKGLGLRTFNF